MPSIPLSQFPHQPGTLKCCRECANMPRNVRDCNVIATGCIDFCIANSYFIKEKKLEASLASQVQGMIEGSKHEC